MAEKRDCYEVLGVSKNAGPDEIKRAYRRLAKQYHPDVNKEADAEEKFKEVQSAYDVLSDENKKAAYDRYGHAGVDGQAGFGGQGFGDFAGFDDFDLGDIFSSIFGGGGSQRRRTGPMKGRNTQVQVEIDFMDAVNGKTISLPLSYDERCTTCDGSGAKDVNSTVTCSKCGGTGQIRRQQNTPFGMVVNTTVCDQCKGTGKEIKDKCPDCHGNGFNHKRITIDLDIPAGINTGQSLRVSGKGERGQNGGPNGDLYVEIIVKSHQHFIRDGSDIYMIIPISIVDATLGVNVDVPTVQGDVELKIPAGIQHGQKLKLKGKGIKKLRSNNEYGDQYVEIDLQVPKTLSRDEKVLYERLRDIEQKNGKGFFDKFRQSFKR